MLNQIFFYYPVMLALKTVKQQVFLEFEKMRSPFELEGIYVFLRRESTMLYYFIRCFELIPKLFRAPDWPAQSWQCLPAA